ncbi:hypothetical protein Tco_0777880 [Tanacetum coccineum]
MALDTNCIEDLDFRYTLINKLEKLILLRVWALRREKDESDVDDSPVNDRFKTGEGFHAVPPPYTRNYMPSRPDLSFVGLDDSVYKTKVSETETSISKTSKDIIEKAKTDRPSAPIFEDWDTDSDNDTAASISTARPVNTVAPKPKVNDTLPITYSYFRAHSPVKRTFNQKLAAKTNKFNEKVNTARVNNVTISAAVGNGENVLSPQHAGFGDQQEMFIDQHSNDSGFIHVLKRFDYVDL